MEMEHSNKPSRYFEITILPENSLDFDFIFHPEDITTTAESSYEFFTSFELKGVENFEQLKRKVTAKVVRSKINFDTTKVVFPKTFIFGSSNNSLYF